MRSVTVDSDARFEYPARRGAAHPLRRVRDKQASHLRHISPLSTQGKSLRSGVPSGAPGQRKPARKRGHPAGSSSPAPCERKIRKVRKPKEKRETGKEPGTPGKFPRSGKSRERAGSVRHSRGLSGDTAGLNRKEKGRKQKAGKGETRAGAPGDSGIRGRFSLGHRARGGLRHGKSPGARCIRSLQCALLSQGKAPLR